MTAEALVDTLHAAGIHLAVNGDRLHVEAPPGQYNAGLRARLIEHKNAVLELIVMRDRLLGITRAIGVPAAIVERLPSSELRACIDQLPLWEGQRDERGEPLQARVLVFYLRALADMEPAVEGSPVDQRRRRTDSPAAAARVRSQPNSFSGSVDTST